MSLQLKSTSHSICCWRNK